MTDFRNATVALALGLAVGATATAALAKSRAPHPGHAARAQAISGNNLLNAIYMVIGSIAADTITGVAFRVRVSDAGLHFVAVSLIGTGLIVLLLTLLDRQLAVPQKDQLHSRSSDATAVRT